MASDKNTKKDLIDEAMHRFGLCYKEILMPVDVLKIYDAIQPDNEISLRHAEESLTQVTALPFCTKLELADALRELDRRNFLLRDLKWEFAFLDYDRSGGLAVDNGYFLFSSMHGKHLDSIWKEFISKRENPEGRLTFDELSLILCSIFNEDDYIDTDNSSESHS